MSWMRRVLETIGRWIIGLIEGLGNFALLALNVPYWAVRPPYRLGVLFQQMEFVGVGSVFIIVLTGFFAGAVFAMQSVEAFRMLNSEGLVGSTVALILTREVGPVFTALMVAGRVGSGMATELGTMRVTEQIDALVTMAVNPVQYLVVPRVLACFIMVPMLTVLFNTVGLFGSYVISVLQMNVDSGPFWGNIAWLVEDLDLYKGVLKSAVFGIIVALIGCYKGYYASGGAKGVGEATTESVVASSITILISDYFMGVILW
jgi:phospholipid/cholesterol/gamma-HCH transport system permease protein